MSEDLNKLRELAEAATPGPWFQSGSPWFQTGGFVLAGSPDPHAGTVLADLSDTWEMQQADDALDADHERDPDKDAAFIAAFNPATALSLLSRLQAAEERAEKLEGAVRTVRQVLIDHGSGTCGPHCEAMYGEETYFKDEIVLLNAALKTEGA